MERSELIQSRLRWAMHLSLDQTMASVGRKIGKEKHAISKYLNGHYSMTIDLVCDLCNALGVRVSWVVGESKPDTRLEVRADIEVNAGTKLTPAMRNKKRLKKIAEPNPEPEFVRSDWQDDRLHVQRETVDMSLDGNPELPDTWHAEQCGVLVPFVNMRRKHLRFRNSRQG